MFDPSRVPGAGDGARLLLPVCFIAFVLSFPSSAVLAEETPSKCPPSTAVKNVRDAYASADIVDPYRWLEDQNSADTRTWIEQEQKCTDAALSRLPSRVAIAKRNV